MHHTTFVAKRCTFGYTKHQKTGTSFAAAMDGEQRFWMAKGASLKKTKHDRETVNETIAWTLQF